MGRRTDRRRPPAVGSLDLWRAIGGQALQFGAGIRYWLDSPDAGPEGFGFRINIVALFPR